MAASYTRFVVLQNSRVYQVNNVTAIAIASPSVINGTYRDQPPTVVGGAGVKDTTSLVVAGGVTPVVTPPGGYTGTTIVIPSSTAQDDQYAHVAPRDYTSKIAYFVFTTTTGLSTYDCLFLLSEVVGIFNAAPPGYPST